MVGCLPCVVALCGVAVWGGFVGCELDSGRDDASLCVCNVFLLLLVF